MLDIKFICDNPELVKENIKKKFEDAKLPLVDELISLYTEKCREPAGAGFGKGYVPPAANQLGDDTRSNAVALGVLCVFGGSDVKFQFVHTCFPYIYVMCAANRRADRGGCRAADRK